MEPEEYALMDATEDAMWWYGAVHALLLRAMHRRPGPPGSAILDAGCGTGGFLRKVAVAAPGRARLGIDYSEDAIRRARTKTDAALAVASILALPFRDECAGLAFSVDVLSSQSVTEEAALAELRRCLQPGGTLILNLPAYKWLYSAHDRRVHNRHRYTRREARAMVEAAGFEQVEAYYWNSLLFPLMVLQRKVLARGGDGTDTSDVARFPPLLEAIFRAVSAAERGLMRLGLRYPFGGSVMVVARKPGP
ncbi:MAG: class I SAM-dependent methyltransferase [Alphaproteobacteria bacterium]|nr:class I SAM-dependent methyltransferase [Alphaproteobacteria bacterium]